MSYDLDVLAQQVNRSTNPLRQPYYLSVAQLRAMLDGLPDDAIVVLAKDGEGNGYSPLSAPVEAVWYIPESTWAGYVHEIGPDSDGETYEPDGSELVAIVLDPIN
jgi:hypothetical protein